MTPREEADMILRAHNAVLARQKKHQVWKLPDGRTWVRASTPSDRFADTNSLAHLRTFLGLNKERGIEGERRPKKQATRKPQAPLVAISGGRVDPLGVQKLRDSLMAAVRKFKPKHDCCFPMERVVVLRTPLTVWMGRWFE